jgi:signal transduction histidine kinase
VYNRLGALSKRVDSAATDTHDGQADALKGVASDIRATLADLQSILGAAPDDVRDLDAGALAEQLRVAGAAQAGLNGITVDFAAPGVVSPVPALLGWDLQCVLDEAIANAVRHGSATRVVVRLTASSDELRLVLADDGRGVHADEPEGTRSGGRVPTGLAGIRDRLAKWGGDARFASSPEGATLTVAVPLPLRRSRPEAG